MNFAELGLRPEIVRAVTGYAKPTSIQEKAIPVVLESRDLIACAQTGTGKTAAFLLPILQQLFVEKPSMGPRALVITPTRELAAQVGEMAKRYGNHLNIRSAVIFGGVGMGPQKRKLAGKLDLLIATPGRLLDHLNRRQAPLDHVRTMVLDEADRMLDMGFLPDVRRILSALPKKRQTLFFSATMPADIEALIRSTSRDPVMLEVARRATPVSSVTQVVHPVRTNRKKELLQAILKSSNMHQTLVFTRTKAGADQLVRVLNKSGQAATAIHSNKSQNTRTRTLAHFRAGKFNVLIATDIAARGLDVEGISHVVNFELPDTPEDYVHRIGRTARAGGSGTAISLVAPQEYKKLAAIERLIKTSIKQEPVSGFIVTPDASKLEPRRKPKRQPTAPSRRKLNRSKDASFSRNGEKQTLWAGRKNSHRKKSTHGRQERSTRTAG
jgi:ATP-dependent RNA helicase RhlE